MPESSKPKPLSADKEGLPLPVIITAEQPPVPVVITAPDGVTPVPIPSMGIAENTAPGASGPVPGYTQDGDTPSTPLTHPISQTMVTQNPNQPPMPVVVMGQAPPPPGATVTKGEGTTLSPTTTEEEDTVTAGQRKISEIWEKTQSWIALMVVSAGVLINSVIVTAVIFFNRETSVTQLALISISLQFINLTCGIVIGFYFSRTNHAAKGGVGPKTEYPYTGR